MSGVYDPNVIRGQAVFPPPGFGTIDLKDFADGDFLTLEFNNGDVITYSRVAGLGVHTVARDKSGGALRLRFQYCSLGNVPLQALANYQFQAGMPNGVVRGAVTVIDPNFSKTIICSDCALANNPAHAYGNEQPVIEYVFRGTISIVHAVVPPLTFGPSGIVLP